MFWGLKISDVNPLQHCPTRASKAVPLAIRTSPKHFRVRATREKNAPVRHTPSLTSSRIRRQRTAGDAAALTSCISCGLLPRMGQGYHFPKRAVAGQGAGKPKRQTARRREFGLGRTRPQPHKSGPCGSFHLCESDISHPHNTTQLCASGFPANKESSQP